MNQFKKRKGILICRTGFCERKMKPQWKCVLKAQQEINQSRGGRWQDSKTKRGE
jgi:hypothetical protein